MSCEGLSVFLQILRVECTSEDGVLLPASVHQSCEKERERKRERETERERERESAREGDSAIESERERASERASESERGRDRDRAQERQRARVRARDRERVQEPARERAIARESDKRHPHLTIKNKPHRTGGSWGPRSSSWRFEAHPSRTEKLTPRRARPCSKECQVHSQILGREQRKRL